MNKKGRKREDEPRVPVKNAADLQRLKIEKLMKNPEKEVVIPERGKEKKLAPPPEFIRNVMGSSAGAGSGEFHVYRHLRRKEYARQKFIQQQKEKVRLDEDYHEKIQENLQVAEARTARKRAKRQKNKEKLKAAKKKRENNKTKIQENESDEEGDRRNVDKEENEVEDKGTLQMKMQCQELDDEHDTSEGDNQSSSKREPTD